MEFAIAAHCWDGSQPETEREWQDCLLDLNHAHPEGDPTLTLDRASDGGIAVEIRQGGESAIHPLSFDLLRDLFRDYGQIIRRLVRAGAGAFGSRDWESLDYAKKLIHDEAGERIMDALNPHLPPENALILRDARRLFTLSFLLTQDLPAALVTRHRLHGTIPQ